MIRVLFEEIYCEDHVFIICFYYLGSVWLYRLQLSGTGQELPWTCSGIIIWSSYLRIYKYLTYTMDIIFPYHYLCYGCKSFFSPLYVAVYIVVKVCSPPFFLLFLVWYLLSIDVWKFYLGFDKFVVRVLWFIFLLLLVRICKLLFNLYIISQENLVSFPLFLIILDCF